MNAGAGASARLLDDRIIGQRDELDTPPAIQEAQPPLEAASGGDGLVHDPLHEGVDVGHRRPAVHPERAAVVVQLADVAGRAVQAHHLLPGDLPVACRHADRKPVGVVLARRVGQESEALDVLEERPIGDGAVGPRDLLLEREQPRNRVGLAALAQVVVLLALLRRQAVAAQRR